MGEGGGAIPRRRTLTRAPWPLWGAAVVACVIGASVALGAGSDGRIRGRVIDRTASHHAVAHQTVRLTIIERGASSDQEAVSDAAGRFQFAGLPVGGIRVFVLSTEYHGVRYTSDRVVLAAAAPVQAVDLIVYEPSSNRSAMRGTVAWAVVDVARGAVRVSVVQGLSNLVSRIFVNVDMPSLRASQ